MTIWKARSRHVARTKYSEDGHESLQEFRSICKRHTSQGTTGILVLNLTLPESPTLLLEHDPFPRQEYLEDYHPGRYC